MGHDFRAGGSGVAKSVQDQLEAMKQSVRQMKAAMLWISWTPALPIAPLAAEKTP